MDYPPLTERFLEAIDRFANPQAALYKRGEKWEGMSSGELLRRVAGVAESLRKLGVGAGDRVALFAPNCAEWHVADLAIVGLGAVNVPIYFNEAPERAHYILHDSGARVVITVGEEAARRVAECRGRLESVEHVIAARPGEPAGATLDFEALYAEAGEAEKAAYRRRAARVRADDLATIIYTSGTTGEPKGVMLTHRNLSSNVTDSLHEHEFSPKDIGLSFLPLAHVYERIVDYGYLFYGVTVAYVEHPLHVASALVEVRPTLAAAVPRFFEKTYANIMEKGRQATGAKRKIFDWALRTAREATGWRAYGQPVSLLVKLRWALADRLVYRRIRAGLGGRMRRFISGGAPLARELAEFYWSIGVAVYQGYGLTETSPVVSTNAPTANRVGTVGRPIPNVEVKIAEDGEIVVRGPCVMQGYYKKREETERVLSAEGWLRTGDIGYVDDEGYLVVTDRKKDLIKTAGGKFVAPQPIENRLKTSPYILNAAVIGDRRKYVVALVVPHFENVKGRGREVGLEFSSDAELATHPQVQEWVGEEVARLTSHLAQYESIKRFALLDHDLTFEGGQLTYTMKLKRRVIEERYAEIIESLYAEEPQAMAPA